MNAVLTMEAAVVQQEYVKIHQEVFIVSVILDIL